MKAIDVIREQIDQGIILVREDGKFWKISNKIANSSDVIPINPRRMEVHLKSGYLGIVAWCHKKVWLTKDFNDEYLWYTHGTGGRKMTVRSKVVAWMPLPEPFKEEEHEQTN